MTSEKTSPFDFVDAVSETKRDLFEEGAREGDYKPYLTNRALSYHPDSVLYANEMNVWNLLPERLQHDYLMSSLRRRKRRSKWFKAEDQDLVETVSRVMRINHRRAREAIKIMSADDVNEIKKIQESMA